MTERLKCMFDSNIFDEFIDRPDLVELITGFVDVVATHVQRDEIDDTKNKCPEEWAELIRAFDTVVPEEPQVGVTGLLSTESAVSGISKWGGAKWSKPENLIGQIRGPIKPKHKRYVNRTRDALIGETAIKNDLTLVTNDCDLRKKVASLGGKSMSWKQLLEHCQR